MSGANLQKILMAGALAAAMVGPVSAQDQDERGWWPRWGMGQMMTGRWGGPMMGYGPDAMLDRIDGRLAFLKTELKITEQQAPAWDELARTVRETAQAHNDLMRAMMDELRDGEFLKRPLPDRLAFQQTHLEGRLEQVKQIKAAVDGLYASLDEEQKKSADEIVLPMMGMGMGRGGRGPGMMFN